ncbi:hypothetical protein DFH06DRAFT_1149151 [Mycena polygramma]|nr:hypothetical protein DFH06DRAFT_1149151 [Mycena polygramma]
MSIYTPPPGIPQQLEYRKARRNFTSTQNQRRILTADSGESESSVGASRDRSLNPTCTQLGIPTVSVITVYGYEFTTTVTVPYLDTTGSDAALGCYQSSRHEIMKITPGPTRESSPASWKAAPVRKAGPYCGDGKKKSQQMTRENYQTNLQEIFKDRSMTFKYITVAHRTQFRVNLRVPLTPRDNSRCVLS